MFHNNTIMFLGKTFSFTPDEANVVVLTLLTLLRLPNLI